MLAAKGGRQREDLKQKYANSDSVENEEVTTLMIRNVPRKYTEDGLICELEDYISQDSYNFLYLPWDHRRSSNVGYAFVNFIDGATALSMMRLVDGRPWRLTQSGKDIKIVPAHVQGLAKNLAHYMDKVVIEEYHAHSPRITHNGQHISFQQAVELYCSPELVQRHRQYKQSAAAEVVSCAGQQFQVADNSCVSFPQNPGPKKWVHDEMSAMSAVSGQKRGRLSRQSTLSLPEDEEDMDELIYASESTQWQSEGFAYSSECEKKSQSCIDSIDLGYHMHERLEFTYTKHMPEATDTALAVELPGACNVFVPALCNKSLDDYSRDEVLSSGSYAAAWHSMNNMLRGVQEKVLFARH